MCGFCEQSCSSRQRTPILFPDPVCYRKWIKASTRKLTIVSAPAGFGKTSLLSDWVAQRAIDAAWISLDSGDNDLHRFWSYVAAALDSAGAGISDSALGVLQSPRQPAIDVVLSDLINELVSMPSDCTLVLDDYHFIENPAIHESLGFLLDNLPARLHLVVAGRSDPPLPLARLRARRQMVELRSDDLRFTEEEATILLNQVVGLELSVDDVALLENRTEGWAAGLQLAALSMQAEENVTEFVRTFTGSHRYVFDYLAQEVLRRLSGPLRTFLLKTSILDRLCDSLSNAVTETEQARSALDELEQANLFIIPLDRERRWYRFHHLFGEFLRAQALQEYGQERIGALNRRASEWYAENGFVEDAVYHALQVGDHETTANLIEQTADKMFTGNELNVVAAWSRVLPEAVMKNHLKLCLIFAWAQLATGQFDEAERTSQVIEQAVGGTVDMLGLEELNSLTPEARSALIETALIKSSLAAVAYDVPRLFELTRMVLPYLSEVGRHFQHAGASDLRTIAVFNMAVAHELMGEVRAASEAFTEAFDLSHAQHNLHIFLVALSHLAQMQIAMGQLNAAEETYYRALQLAEEVSGRPSPLAGPPYVGLGNLFYERNDLDSALVNLEDGLTLCRRWNNWDGLLPGYIGVARVKSAKHDWSGAFGALDECTEMCRKANLGMMLPVLEAVRSMLSLAKGDLTTAARWAESFGLSLQSEMSYQREGENIIYAKVLLARGRHVEAQQFLGRLSSAAQNGQRTGRMIEISVIQALNLQALGDDTEALAVLEQVLARAESEKYVRIFVDEGAPMADLLREVRGRGIAPAYVQKLLDAFLVQESVVQVIRRMPVSRLFTELDSGRRTLPYVEALSSREMEVLHLISSGASNEEIAQKLFVSVNTVKTHIKNIYGKLGARNRTQAVATARDLNLL